MLKLNLPFHLAGKTVLLAGAGGGWDVLGAVPLAYELEGSGCRVVLANYSSLVAGFTARLAQAEDVIESAIAQALGKPVYVFGKEGATRLRAGYEEIVQDHGIDTIILVDGGVDSLMRGDEEGPGSILQDALSLLVVNGLSVPCKLLACIGFGTETDEGVCHYRVLENMAALAKDGTFLGACALTKAMAAFQFYEKVCRTVFQLPIMRSHVHTRIIPAVQGEFGRYEMFDDAFQPLDLLSARPPFLSPLMSLYWFFEVAGVFGRNVLAPHLVGTESYADAQSAYEEQNRLLRGKLRATKEIPL